MAPSPSSSSSPHMEWKLSQVFGERVPGEEVVDDDVVSAVQFDKTGDYLAVGDRGGRVVVFERKDGKHSAITCNSRKELEQLDSPGLGSGGSEYQYKSEFQSHEPEFDYLKSVEIEEKINSLRWCGTQSRSRFILTTNDKTIKLWKVKEHKVKKVKEMDTDSSVYSENALLSERSLTNCQSGLSAGDGNHLEWTENAYAEDTARAICRKLYAQAHDFNINSISNNSDGETFISADDLRINLWNLEISSQCFNIIDMKPSSMEDLTEVITSAEFDPIHCNLLAFSSSRGFVRLVDMRQSALCDNTARILRDAECQGSTSFFTEIIASISDLKFKNDGIHILTRDYMNLKLWDLRMESSPVEVFKVHENLRPKLCELYNNDSIFDKFECCISGDEYHFATGSYSNFVRIFSNGTGGGEGITIEASKNPSRKPNAHSSSRTRRSSLSNLTRGFYRQVHENSSAEGSDFLYNMNAKLQHLAWHPTANLIAAASGNSLFMYYA